MKGVNEKYLKSRPYKAVRTKKWVVSVGLWGHCQNPGEKRYPGAFLKRVTTFCSSRVALLFRAFVLSEHLSCEYHQPPTYSFHLGRQDCITAYLHLQDKPGFASHVFCFCFFTITRGWVQMGYARGLQPVTPNSAFSNWASAKAWSICSLPEGAQWKRTPHPSTGSTSLDGALYVEV